MTDSEPNDALHTTPRLQLTGDIDDVVHYVAIHNNISFINSVCVKNPTEEEIDDVEIAISLSGGFAEDFWLHIDRLRPGEERFLRNLDVILNAEKLLNLTERVICTLKIEALQKERILANDVRKITILAFDEWPGLLHYPELLAAFVMPNHPVIAKLAHKASELLREWTGSPSLNGYQSGNRDRVKKMAAAVFSVIQQENITYAEPPSSFEKQGQRIRLPDAVLDQRLGTCMDLTLLYASCLEYMGLHPILVLVKGHIFAGVWLLDSFYPDITIDDPTFLEKQASSGISEILLVESTKMCAGKASKFDEAVACALINLSNYDNFDCAYDVKRARLCQVVPLPYRIKTADGYAVQPKKRNDVDFSSPDALGEIIETPSQPESNSVGKIAEWERKLLDLSLRNTLINLRFNSSIVPLALSEISKFEDLLSGGKVFQIQPLPLGAESPQKNEVVDVLKKIGIEFKAQIEEDVQHGTLLSLLPEKGLKSSLTKIYRAAKTAAEENGVSSLYLALGLLKWNEGTDEAPSKGTSLHYAPVILMPVELIRKSASIGYVLQASDEPADVNVTLLEFLRQNYEISIEGLDPLPIDDSGLDVSKIFALIRNAIKYKKGWDIVETCCLGNFTFSQFVMWREVHNGEQFLQKCNTVRSLITGDVPFSSPIADDVDAAEAYVPVSLDASQLHAVKLAAADTSFILHGPPGTGKSQTITAMIVNALARGKRVLFVAEKMAALEVVKKRLDTLGFQNFCLELHSNKASKKETLEQLKRAAAIGDEHYPTQYSYMRKKLLDQRRTLDRYRLALHRVRPFGKSIRQVIDIYESLPDHGKMVKFDSVFLNDLTETELENCRQTLEQFVEIANEIDVSTLQPLEIIGKEQQFTQRMKFDLEPTLKTYLKELEAFRSALDEFAETTGLEPPRKIIDIEKTRKIACEVIDSQNIPNFIKAASNLNEVLNVPDIYLKKQAEFQMWQTELCKQWNEEFLADDMTRFKTQFEAAVAKKFFFKTWALKKLARTLQIYVKEDSDFKVIPTEILSLLRDVELFQESKKRFETAQETLPHEWKSFLEKHSTPNAFQEFRNTVQKWSQSVENPARYRKLVESGRWEDSFKSATRLKERYRDLAKAQKNVVEIITLRGDNNANDWIDSRIAFCKTALDNLTILKKWFEYRNHRVQCHQLGIGVLCDVCKNDLRRSEVVEIFLRSVYQQLAVRMIDSEPFLNQFSGTKFNLQIEQFKKIDHEFMEIARMEALNKLYEQREKVFYASTRAQTELKILSKTSKSARGLALRSLFAQIPTILPALCPCMLMSPLSVAQYLETTNDMFDLVIFDEASQIPTHKAVGTIARAKNAVIAGDPLQMPPTNFFAVGDNDDEANILTEDLKSVLDDCLALGMPETHLEWHYRSRHESLIAFSNKEFYEPEGKEMRTFPSVNDRERRVRLVKVNGIFERGSKRVNREEAKAIVAEIKRRFASATLSEQSIGVVTFNMPQQELIEDMLLEEYQNDPAFDAWANEGKGEIFVKNLENVQGDERDVILFSIAFAPDADGKLLFNFGPINKEGGWKRLNVAVTRARSEMVVFTSMTYDMIDLKRTKAKGVRALKNFLEFAQKGSLHDEYIEKAARKNEGVLEAICRRLAEEGYKFQRGVGRSSFKIDVGVINPFNEDEYLLGILLDGEVYRGTPDTKDREISQKSALENLGWNVYRIWTMDWWEDSKKELDKLIAILAERLRKVKQTS